MQALPKDLLLQVFLRLDTSSRAQAERTCTSWHRLLSSAEARDVWGEIRWRCTGPAEEHPQEISEGAQSKLYLQPQFRWLARKAQSRAVSCLKIESDPGCDCSWEGLDCCIFDNIWGIETLNIVCELARFVSGTQLPVKLHIRGRPGSHLLLTSCCLPQLADHLVQLHLHALCLDPVGLATVSLQQLGCLHRLQKLSVHLTAVDKEAPHQLHPELAHLTSLTFLRLGTHDAPLRLVLPSALSTLPRLMVFETEWVDAALQPVLLNAALSEMLLEGGELDVPSGSQDFSGCSPRRLVIHEAELHGHVRWLLRMPRLQSLTLSADTDDIAVGLDLHLVVGQLTGLTQLRLTGRELFDGCSLDLQGLTGLVTMEIDRLRLGQGFVQLPARSDAMTSLTLTGLGMTGFEAPLMPNLHLLDLRHNNLSGQTAISGLPRMQSLAKLKIFL